MMNDQPSTDDYRQLIESFAQAVWEANAAGQIVDESPSWRAYTGQTTAQWLGEGWIDAVHPHQRQAVLAQWRQAVNEQKPVQAEYQLQHAQGGWRWTSVQVTPVFEPDGSVRKWIGLNVDITDRQQAQEALRQANRHKDEFLAMLAHELRNPLATVRNGLTILSLPSEPDGLTHQTMTAATVAMMNRQVTHLVHMVDDLLDVSRISRGNIELKRERLDWGVLVAEAVEAMHPEYETRHKGLHLASSPTSLLVDGDATRLGQVITNLLTNGLRYTGEEGQVWVGLQAEQGQAVLRVSDNGLGLSADQLGVIFDLFVQVDQSLARSQGGLGVGLTLAQRLVQQHGGRIEAHSGGLGQGSEFVVFLPLVEEPSPEQAMGTRSVFPPSRPRILVIDDNADAALSLSMLLKLKGYEVQSRLSGQAGLQAADEWRPGVIVCDISMPGLDGYQTARLIREQPWGAAIYLLALTGYGQAEDKQRSEAAGFDAHLVKPVDMAELLGIVGSRTTNPNAR